MKATMKYLSMAILALVGVVMAGCSADDSIASEQQPDNGSRTITLKTTVGEIMDIFGEDNVREMVQKKTAEAADRGTKWIDPRFCKTPADSIRQALEDGWKESCRGQASFLQLIFTACSRFRYYGFCLFCPQ